MKPPVSARNKQLVLELRSRHSLREVAEQTGLPIGTVKTICSRSGAFRDNLEHRALFSLPPIKVSNQTLPSVPELPAQKKVTGDKEVDAVLWLREVIGTGQAALIAKAMEGAKKIKTPLKTLEERYKNWLRAKNPGNLFATFSAIGFDDLEGWAKKSIDKAARQHEAHSRFGDALFNDTDAEIFCIDTLAGLKMDNMGFFNAAKVAARFKACPELLPQTLSDCLRELAYWDEMWRLRSAVDFHAAESDPAVYARKSFVFDLLGEIRPRSKDESLAVMRWMISDKQNNMDRGKNTDAILLNLIN